MIKVSDETKTAYKSYSTPKSVEIRIPNLNIVLTDEVILQSVTLQEAIEEGQNLSFTGCVASEFSFSCADIAQELKGQYIEADMKMDGYDTVPLFSGYIEKATNTSHEQETMTITAYDALYKLPNIDVTSWYNSLSFPISVRNMRISLFNHLGLTQKDVYLSNDSISIPKNIEDSTIKADKILKYLCQINGVYGRMGRTGIFEYVELTPAIAALYPAEDLYPNDDVFPSAENALESVTKATYMSIDFENYLAQGITKVQIVDKAGQIVASHGSNNNNTFTLSNNPLVYGLSQAQLNSVANNLYNVIQGLEYTPVNVTCVGMPYVECGDLVFLATRRSIIRSYIGNRTLRGTQALKDTYVVKGDEYRPTYTPSVQSQLNANSYAISTETTRATTAETNEYNRATQAETRISNLVATKATITDLTATNARVSNLSAEIAEVESLTASKASISDLNAVSASVNSLWANKASVSDLDAVEASVNNLRANAITTGNLKAQIGNIDFVRVNGLQSNNNIVVLGNLNVSGVGNVANEINSIWHEIESIKRRLT